MMVMFRVIVVVAVVLAILLSVRFETRSTGNLLQPSVLQVSFFNRDSCGVGYPHVY